MYDSVSGLGAWLSAELLAAWTPKACMDEANSGDASSFKVDQHEAAFLRGSSAVSLPSDLPPEISEPGSPALIPPYWQQHRRHESHTSVRSEGSVPIRLLDHTDDSHEQNKAVWAKRLTIDDYVLVSGNLAGIGNYVVWNCTIETVDVS